MSILKFTCTEAGMIRFAENTGYPPDPDGANRDHDGFAFAVIAEGEGVGFVHRRNADTGIGYGYIEDSILHIGAHVSFVKQPDGTYIKGGINMTDSVPVALDGNPVWVQYVQRGIISRWSVQANSIEHAGTFSNGITIRALWCTVGAIVLVDTGCNVAHHSNSYSQAYTFDEGAFTVEDVSQDDNLIMYVVGDTLPSGEVVTAVTDGYMQVSNDLDWSGYSFNIAWDAPSYITVTHTPTIGLLPWCLMYTDGVHTHAELTTSHMEHDYRINTFRPRQPDARIVRTAAVDGFRQAGALPTDELRLSDQTGSTVYDSLQGWIVPTARLAVPFTRRVPLQSPWGFRGHRINADLDTPVDILNGLGRNRWHLNSSTERGLYTRKRGAECRPRAVYDKAYYNPDSQR